jgi:RNA polymerase sigma factor (sigma-70 family)
VAGRIYDTSMGGAEDAFPATRWTQINDPTQREAILGELYQRYWKPIYHYLRCRGHSNENAKDLVQDFFTEKVFAREFIQKADKNKGRFRTFLLTAVRNYAIDLQRKAKPTYPLEETLELPAAQSDPAAAFTRVWAEEILQGSLTELKTECEQSDTHRHWELFQAWFLDSKERIENKQMKDLCAQLRITDIQQGYVIIAKMKDRFRVILRRRLRPVVASEGEIDAEIREFSEIFS